MQRRAEKLMRDYCVSLGQNLDQPVVEYLARSHIALTGFIETRSSILVC